MNIWALASAGGGINSGGGGTIVDNQGIDTFNIFDMGMGFIETAKNLIEFFVEKREIFGFEFSLSGLIFFGGFTLIAGYIITKFLTDIWPS